MADETTPETKTPDETLTDALRDAPAPESSDEAPSAESDAAAEVDAALDGPAAESAPPASDTPLAPVSEEPAASDPPAPTGEDKPAEPAAPASEEPAAPTGEEPASEPAEPASDKPAEPTAPSFGDIKGDVSELADQLPPDTLDELKGAGAGLFLFLADMGEVDASKLSQEAAARLANVRDRSVLLLAAIESVFTRKG